MIFARISSLFFLDIISSTQFLLRVVRKQEGARPEMIRPDVKRVFFLEMQLYIRGVM